MLDILYKYFILCEVYGSVTFIGVSIIVSPNRVLEVSSSALDIKCSAARELIPSFFLFANYQIRLIVSILFVF